MSPDLGYAAAVAGGVLALISPCSALLLPSFFAYAFQRRARLLARTGLFYAGLLVTLVPLGVGAGWASALFYGHRALLVSVAGWLIIALGTVQVFGGGFAFGPAIRLQQRVSGGHGILSTLGLGAAYGLAGFCSGPILGAVLTVAAIGGQPVRGGVLLAVYALGMAAPLFLLALLWDRFDLGRRRWLRGRAVRVGPLRLHTTMLASGLLFVAIGVLFLAFQGTAGLPGWLGLGDTTDPSMAAQGWVRTAGEALPDWALLLGLAVLALAIAGWKLLRSARTRNVGGVGYRSGHE